ncbi:conserved membrane protein of unknown function [Candidatus Hydrogenisulfobacillus filiaventi]|uniref:Rhomboid family intramembrane serine protease n=1 Tax=Candidatus Hydrogenisulfobacillus filiaventi TaxID=2707344 RepID=A0A6F8ZCQ7_9FIRM|nr:hypothetical protein [Bacillota bacterium]CAB1127523.1 conserved membrane protein of unknown function [Candidatus Hydrogenisulfobacillus filiaventi]
MDREARAFWKQRRREMLRRERRQRGLGGGTRITWGLIGLLAAGWLLETVAPGIPVFLAAAGGPVVRLLLAWWLPGGLLGLVFAGAFVWLIGSQLEAVLPAWQYLLLFILPGLAGALVTSIAGGFAGGLAPFGLAGGYVALLRRISPEGAAQWALGLLLINVLLTGLNWPVLAAMAVTFGAGYGLARLWEN